MSASTSSKTGSATVSAGGAGPDWWSSAARPTVFSATVLPPVFGPLMTSARRSPGRDRSVRPPRGRAADAVRRPAAPRPRRSTGAPRQPRETIPRASARSIGAHRLDGARSRPRARHGAESSRRIRSTSSRSAATASEWPVVQLDDRRTARRRASGRSPRRRGRCRSRCAARSPSRRARAGRRAAVTKSSCRCSRKPLEPARAARAARSRAGGRSRSSPRSLRSFGDAVSRRSEPSSSIARLDRLCERRQRRIDRGAELVQERRGLPAPSSGGPRAQRAARPCRPRAAASRGEDAAERRVRRGLADVVQPFERRLLGDVEQRDRLGGQRLATRDLAGIGRRHERSARAPRRAESRSRWRAAPRSRGTRGRRVRSDPRDECRPPRVERIRSPRTMAMGWRRAHTRLHPAQGAQTRKLARAEQVSPAR